MRRIALALLFLLGLALPAHAAVSFVSKSALADNGTGKSLTIAVPASEATNDLIIVNIVTETATSTTIGPPDNTWHREPLTAGIGTGNPRSDIYYHVITGTEPASYLFTFADSVRAVGVAVDYRGVSSIDIMGLNSGTSALAMAPQVTPYQSGGTLLQFVANQGGSSSITLDAALASRYNSNAGDGSLSMAMGDIAAPSSGLPSTAYTNTVSSAGWITTVMVLNPTNFGDGIIKSASEVGPVPTGTSVSAFSLPTTVDSTVPGAIQNGDILVGFLRIIWGTGGLKTAKTITPPAGWTKIREDFVDGSSGAGQAIQTGIYTHPVTAPLSEPSTYTWTIDSGTGVNVLSVEEVAVRGVSAVDTTSYHSTQSSVNSFTSTGIAVAGDNEPVLIFSSWGTDAGSQQNDTVGIECVANCQGKAHTVFGTIGGLAGSTLGSTTVFAVQASSAAIYEMGFVPAVTNAPKVIGWYQVNVYPTATATAGFPLSTPSSPATPAVGDVLVAHVVTGTGVTISPPAGFNSITNGSADDGTQKAEAFVHTVAGGDSSPVTFGLSPASSAIGSIIAFRNVTASAIAANATTAGMTPSLSAIQAQSVVLMFEMYDNTALGSNGIGLPEAMLLTPFIYNANVRNGGGSQALVGALSVFLQTGSAGGVTGKNFRAINSGSGPQLTIALPAPTSSPTVTPTPTPTPTPTESPSPTPTPTATATATSAPTPTPAPVPVNLPPCTRVVVTRGRVQALRGTPQPVQVVYEIPPQILNVKIEHLFANSYECISVFRPGYICEYRAATCVYHLRTTENSLGLQ